MKKPLSSFLSVPESSEDGKNKEEEPGGMAQRFFYVQLKPRRQLTLPVEMCSSMNAAVGSFFSVALLGDQHCLLTLERPRLEQNVIKSIEKTLSQKSSGQIEVGLSRGTSMSP